MYLLKENEIRKQERLKKNMQIIYDFPFFPVQIPTI